MSSNNYFQLGLLVMAAWTLGIGSALGVRLPSFASAAAGIVTALAFGHSHPAAAEVGDIAFILWAIGVAVIICIARRNAVRGLIPANGPYFIGPITLLALGILYVTASQAISLAGVR